MMPLGQAIMREMAISPQQFSFLVAAYTFGAAISALLASVFIDRFDRKSGLMAFYSGFIVGTFACSMARSFEFLLIARFVTGFFGGVVGSLVIAMVSDAVPYQRRGTALGIVMGSFSLASILGVPISLKIANMYTWSTPFAVLAVLATAVLVLIHFKVPSMRGHLARTTRDNLGDVIQRFLKTPNQQVAVVFMFCLVMSQFTVIPFISASLVANAAYPEADLPFLYMFGGTASIITSVVVGRLSDRFGKLPIFCIASSLSVIPIFLITNMQPHPLWILLVITSSFFMTVSGRMVPATTMMSSATHPEHRGSFMSITTAAQQLSAAFAAAVSGFIVVADAEGHLSNYPTVGYLAIGFTALAIFMGSKLRVYEETAPVTPEPPIVT